MIRLKWILENLALPRELPEQLVNLEKSINSLIDGWVKKLQELKSQHEEYIRQFLRQSGGSALQGRLASGERLDSNISTGDCFRRLVEEL